MVYDVRLLLNTRDFIWYVSYLINSEDIKFSEDFSNMVSNIIGRYIDYMKFAA
jgi:hypothetical protein